MQLSKSWLLQVVRVPFHLGTPLAANAGALDNVVICGVYCHSFELHKMRYDMVPQHGRENTIFTTDLKHSMIQATMKEIN